MQIVNDEQLLRRYLLELDVKSKLDIDRVKPILCKFEKGELLSGPHIRQRYLLFLISGIVQIYGIQMDGRKIPVNLAKQGDIIGDVEFCNARSSNLFSEAVKEVLCVGISITDYRDTLEQDVLFLRYLLTCVSAKVYMVNMSESPIVSVKEKLLHYMDNECEGHMLNGIEHATMRLQCSRRQLQRVLQELCEQGVVVKVGKGRYRLAE